MLARKPCPTRTCRANAPGLALLRWCGRRGGWVARVGVVAVAGCWGLVIVNELGAGILRFELAQLALPLGGVYGVVAVTPGVAA